MKKISIEQIKIISINERKKGQISFHDDLNLVISEKNSVGKSLFFNAIVYVLGMKNNPFESLRNNDFNDNNNDLCLAVLFNVNDSKFWIVRKNTIDSADKQKNIFVFDKELKLIKKYRMFSRSKNYQLNGKKNSLSRVDNLEMFAEDVYKKLDISSLRVLSKSNSNLSIVIPTIQSILGFFFINENNQTDEFEYFDDGEISKKNKFNIDGRLITYMILSGELTKEQAKKMLIEPINNIGELEEIKLKKEQIYFALKKITDQLDLLIKFRESNEYKNLVLKIDDFKSKRLQLLEKLERIKKENQKLTKEKDNSNKERIILSDFHEKNGREVISFSDEGTIREVRLKDIFSKIFVTSNYDYAIGEIDKRIKINESLIKGIKEELKIIIQDQKKTEDVLDSETNSDKTISLEEGKIAFRNLEKKLITELNDLIIKEEEINKKQKANNKKLSDILDFEYFDSYKTKQIKYLYEDVIYKFSNNKMKEEPHISIPDFPISKTSRYNNTGSSSIGYALTKMYFYMKKITLFNPFYVIDYKPSGEAVGKLKWYNNKMVEEIFKLSVERKLQLIMFKTNNEDESEIIDYAKKA